MNTSHTVQNDDIAMKLQRINIDEQLHQPEPSARSLQPTVSRVPPGSATHSEGQPYSMSERTRSIGNKCPDDEMQSLLAVFERATDQLMTDGRLSASDADLNLLREWILDHLEPGEVKSPHPDPDIEASNVLYRKWKGKVREVLINLEGSIDKMPELVLEKSNIYTVTRDAFANYINEGHDQNERNERMNEWIGMFLPLDGTAAEETPKETIQAVTDMYSVFKEDPDSCSHIEGILPSLRGLQKTIDDLDNSVNPNSVLESVLSDSDRDIVRVELEKYSVFFRNVHTIINEQADSIMTDC